MSAFLNHHLEILKSSVLVKSGFKSIAPGNCKVISVNIFNSTRQSISETTLKRVYGFAHSKFRPSLFTIDAMAKYCGYGGWDDFCQQQEGQVNNNAGANTNWEGLKKNASKITHFTLQALKNKSGIPYNQTIQRQFINQHLNEFLLGNYNATVLTSPAGYGKTIALCHWAEHTMGLSSTGESNDIVLFFSSSALMNVFLSGRDLNDWLLALLGYSKNEDIQSLLDNGDNQPGNFFLIIDGLDEHSYKSETFNLLVNQVLDIAALYQNIPWFKLILTMRSATWMNNKHLLQNSNIKWHTGFASNPEGVDINVPLFSLPEIKELCLKINPAIKSFLAFDIAGDFNHPLYFQFYYKEHKENFSLCDINHICLYELISTFVLNKLYLGPYSAEKILLLNALVSHLDFKNNIYEIDKLKANALVKQYSHAYHELVSVGFLREINTSADLQYHTAIQFTNRNFLDFSIAKNLLQKNGDVFDGNVVSFINGNFTDGQHRLSLLKWCIINAIKTPQPNSFDVLTLAELSEEQKSDLRVFLAELQQKTRLDSHLLKKAEPVSM
nr:hypothetical protein [uncultured Mucilaginibacter sp.]